MDEEGGVEGATPRAVILSLISVTVISLLSLAGVFIVPCVSGSLTTRSRWMNVFVALAVSTLSADAILHLIPQAIEDHHMSKEHDQLIKLSVILAAVYILYMLEFVASWGLKRNRRIHHEETPRDTRKASLVSMSIPGEDAELCFGLRSVALVVLIGDAVHNFVDGIAVGATFVVSTRLGFSTSIAVICDFAILLESGLSVSRALVLNLISALTAFLGLFFGIAAGNHEGVVVWLLAVTAGMFLYVAWLDMLNHLKHGSHEKDKWYMALGLQNLGFFVGFAVIFLIGWFEDKIGNL